MSNVTSIQNRLTETLGMIPPQTWQLIVKKDLQWQHLEPLRKIFLQGSFSVFLIAVGLNAFQLKGKAETAYWAKLYELLQDCDSIPSIEVLAEHLAKFYQKERLYNSKLERLSRFMSSPLAKDLWTKSFQEISTMTADIRQELGNAMNQALHEKTICFAMKCLGVSLMMSGEYEFDFSDVPIPVDSRICKFTDRLGLNFGKNTRKIQQFWQRILALLHLSQPKINMIHFDSIIWQIAHHNADELMDYFKELDLSEAGRRLVCLL